MVEQVKPAVEAVESVAHPFGEVMSIVAARGHQALAELNVAVDRLQHQLNQGAGTENGDLLPACLSLIIGGGMGFFMGRNIRLGSREMILAVVGSFGLGALTTHFTGNPTLFSAGTFGAVGITVGSMFPNRIR